MLSHLDHKKSQRPLKSIAKLYAKMRKLSERYDLGMTEILILKKEREEAALERQQMREEIAALRERLAFVEGRLNQIYNLSQV